jgi:diamine N-acetyltransferase
MAAEIRRATPEDAATVALLGRITFVESFGHLFRSHPHELRSYLDRTFGVGKIEISLAKPGNVYWLAYRDHLPVGYAEAQAPFRAIW